jgi:hypothetical protein
MNFKQWLLLTEAKKDINLSNLNLTTTIPPLNASVSNPNFTTTIPPLNASVSNPNLTTTIPPLNANVSNPNLTTIKISNRELASNKKVEALGIKYQELGGKYPPEFKNFLNNKRSAYQELRKGSKSRYTWYPSDIEVAEKNGLPKNWMLQIDLEKESNKQVEALGIRYQALGTGEYPSEFKNFLKIKRRAYKDYKKGKENPELKWYPSDIEVAEKNGLPKNWMGPQMEILKSKNKQKSNDRLEELAIYYGRNGSAPSTHESDKKYKSLAAWLYHKKDGTTTTYKSDDITWAEIVALSKNWNKEDFPHELPDNWREIKPSGEKSLGEEYVLSILTELGIENKTQYRDRACKNKMCLPFDFSITHNGKKYFLEYNGKQHYYPSYFGSGEEMTKQEIAKYALNAFEIQKENDTIKYDHCVKYKIPFLVIPYWLYKNENQDIIKSTIIKFLKTNKFNETFADPDVPQNYKAYHDRMLKMTKCFAKGKANCKELFKKQKTTFEQFLINKNFINI